MSEQISRRQFGRTAIAAAAGALAAPAVWSRPARAAEFTIRYANNAPINFPTNVRAREAAAKIKAATDGQVNILIFPNNQLGGDPEMLSQVRNGAIQMYAVPGLLAQSIVPDAGIHCLAFAFRSYDELWPAIDGDLGKFICASMDKMGIKTMTTAMDNGFRQVTSRDRTITVPADLAGFKIRTAAFPMMISLFEHLGAATTTVSIKETYAALQTKLVDGQENPLPAIDVLKFYEVQKRCALTNHTWDGFWYGINAEYWDKLPSNVQSVVEAQLNEAAKLQRQDIAAQNDKVRKDLTARGMVFNDAKVDDFRAKLRAAGFYEKWRGSYSQEAWSKLEQAVGKLT